MTPPKPRRRRSGLTMIETLVSFTLLATVLSVTAPLLVRHNRLLADQRAYRQAVDCLSNELDRLTALSGEELTAAIETLPEIDFELVAGEIKGVVEPDDVGQKITLTFTWPEHSTRPPITLVAWAMSAEPTSGGTR